MVRYSASLLSFLTVALVRANRDRVLLRSTPTTMKVCNGDNCFNAYRHSTSIASAFCSTYIESTVTETVTPTVTVYYPGPGTITPTSIVNTIPAQTTNAQLAARCQDNDNSKNHQSTELSVRLSSACSCLAVAPTTVTFTTDAPAATTTVAPSNGVYFQLHCGLSYNTAFFQEFLDYVSFDQCMDQCAYTEGCVAINFRGKAAPFTCDLLAKSDGEVLYAYDSAEVIPAP